MLFEVWREMSGGWMVWELKGGWCFGVEEIVWEKMGERVGRRGAVREGLSGVGRLKGDCLGWTLLGELERRGRWVEGGEAVVGGLGRFSKGSGGDLRGQ